MGFLLMKRRGMRSTRESLEEVAAVDKVGVASKRNGRTTFRRAASLLQIRGRTHSVREYREYSDRC